MEDRSCSVSDPSWLCSWCCYGIVWRWPRILFFSNKTVLASCTIACFNPINPRGLLLWTCTVMSFSSLHHLTACLCFVILLFNARSVELRPLVGKNYKDGSELCALGCADRFGALRGPFWRISNIPEARRK